MTRRLDLYGECNLGHAPVDVFTAECCMRCINPDCTRSQFGTSHFDNRVQNWYERMFSEVPRMDPGDSRFEAIRAQKFLLIQPSISVSSAWVDPRDLEPQVVEAPLPAAQPVVEIPVKVETVAPAPISVPTPEPSSEPVPETTSPSIPSSVPRRVDPTINTPPKSGQMVGSKATPAGQGWVQPTLPTPGPQVDNAKIVRTGAKIKLGGSGESGV